MLAEEQRFAHTLALGAHELEKLFQEIKDIREEAEDTISGIEGGYLQDFLHEGGRVGDLRSFLPFENRSDEDGLPVSIEEAADLLSSRQATLPGDRAFQLYDTFGMPLDFIQDAARDQGFAFDQAGFDHAMAEQKSRARASWKGAAKQTANPAYQQLPKSDFEGYRQTRSDNCEVLAIIKGGQGAQELKAGESGEIILDHTPFYAESGGQVGDRGWLYSDDHNTVLADVTGCYYPVQGVRAHQVVVEVPDS